MSEVIHGIERTFAPDEVLDISEDTKRRLADLILDQTIELPSSDRGALHQYTKLSDKQFISLFRPLVDILELEPDKGELPLHHIDRASKLGITPSSTTLFGRMTLSDVQNGLGLNSKRRFETLSKNDLIQLGRRLADHLDNRPSKTDITMAANGEYSSVVDTFPTVHEISRRFGKISTFHELIGRPVCRDWEHDDYMDWAYAFYKQNPQTQLSARKMQKLSSRGLGPSDSNVRIVFGSISKYKNLSAEHYDAISKTELKEKSTRYDLAMRHADRDERFHEILTAVSVGPEVQFEDRALQIYGQYILSNRLLENIDLSLRSELAKIESAEKFAQACIKISDRNLNKAEIETTAVILGVFDDLWPMYRFQNVNLQI